MTITIPSQNSADSVKEINTKGQPIVIIGANGSGKSRMGYQIEQLNQTNEKQVIRIAAHRALKLPTNIETLNLEQAEKNLKYGDINGNAYYKYQNEPPTVYLQDDYGKLLSFLIAQETKRNAEYIAIARATNDGKLPLITDSLVDTAKNIWSSILPHRSIDFQDGKVVATVGDSAYNGKEMSDGERVALYLVGYCLSAPSNAIIIVDEPELHLHRSLMSNLWMQVEKARPDCQLIYITHDLDFASSRTKCIKIWIKSFSGAEGSTWDWQIVPEVDNIPEELLLEIVGSRKPILFVEGEKGSYDYELFQYLFPKFTIIPRGGSAKVIESTKALKINTSLHNIEAWGLVDRDYKSEQEIVNYHQHNIRVCDVAEIENLLITPELIELVAVHQGHSNPAFFVEKATDFVIGKLKEDFQREVSYTTSLEINFKLNAFDKKMLGLPNIKQSLSALLTSIDADAIYEQQRALYQNIIDTRDLKKALRYYTNKGLLPRMSGILLLGTGEYGNLILRLLKTDKQVAIVAALQQYVPAIEPSSITSPAVPTPSIAV
jgi:ABC-type lipoprotein export system ATPase subunit